MIKKPNTKWLICVGIMVLVGFGFFVATFLVHLSADIYIFADIEECRTLETLDGENGKFTRYEDRTIDNHLGDLQYTSSFCGEYVCKRYRFEIFAYEFEGEATAKAYFENATGKSPGTIIPNFVVSSGFSKSHIIVLDGNKAYTVLCSVWDLQDVLQILEDHFTVKIVEGILNVE